MGPSLESRRRSGRMHGIGRRTLATAAALLVVALSLPAHAEELDEPGRLAAVQKRKFHLDQEVFATASLLPLDAFYKGVGPSGGFTLHFGDTWAWELVRAGYSFNIETSLREQLKDFNVAPTRLEQIQLLVGSAVMFKPLYGKLALLNESVVHGEVYGLLGATVARYETSFKPGPQLGLGGRIFLSRSVSLRIETRYHLLVSDGLEHVVEICSGLALNLGGDD